MSKITIDRAVVEQALYALGWDGSESSEQEKHKIRLALREALEQPQVQSGGIPPNWKLVPVEPTQEMQEAGKNAHHEAEKRIHDPNAWEPGGFATRKVRASHVYQAMLAAAPHPTVVEQPQVEQQPVAWMYDFEIDGEPIHDWLTSDYDEAHNTKAVRYNIRPLYTHPQPRQPLTDEQITDLWIKHARSGACIHAFAQAIERLHVIGDEA